jgi:hypothetical protein
MSKTSLPSGTTCKLPPISFHTLSKHMKLARRKHMGRTHRPHNTCSHRFGTLLCLST